MSPLRSASVLLFDLGGVLIDNVTFEALPALLPAPMARTAMQKRWLNSPAVQRFERGEIEPGEFAERFVNEWALGISPAEFLEAFAAWPRGMYPGAAETLGRLRRRHTIALLSNCNVVHWARMQPVLAHADHAFSSHECGLVKPDPAIFHHVVATLGCAAQDVTFFDDSAANVSAARELGMQARHTVGFDALKQAVFELGLRDTAR